VYIGQDEDGRQLWHWVGRFELKPDRDAAVAKAKTENPWLKDTTGPAIIVGEWGSLTFGAFTLTRPGELFALDWEDIDLDTARARVERRLSRDRPAEVEQGAHDRAHPTGQGRA
jgi:integrase